jgi:hypothetical protein
MPATADATRKLPEHKQRDVLQLFVRVDQRLLRTSRESNTNVIYDCEAECKQGISREDNGMRPWGRGVREGCLLHVLQLSPALQVERESQAKVAGGRKKQGGGVIKQEVKTVLWFDKKASSHLRRCFNALH